MKSLVKGPPADWEFEGVSNPAVLRAMRSVPRHEFVPADLKHLAYQDRPLPIGRGQTISQPFMVAHMAAALQPGPNDRVLEIGTGCGYHAAVLAEMVHSVFSVEIDEALACGAAERLRRLGYRNVHVRHADGGSGWIEEAPFDSIWVACAAPDVPDLLLKQLKDGGRLVVPIGQPQETQELILVEKRGRRLVRRRLMFVRFVPLRHNV